MLNLPCVRAGTPSDGVGTFTAEMINETEVVAVLLCLFFPTRSQQAR